MRFGSVDTFLEFGDWGFRMGRPVANESFLRALLRHGSFDSYHFYCPDVFHAEELERRLSGASSRLQTSTQTRLAEALRANDFSAFHLGDFTHFLPLIVGMRDHYAKRPFPITGITHSLDGVGMHQRFTQLVVAGVAPFDGIVCTSRCAEELVLNKFREVNSLFQREFDVRSEICPRTKVIPLGIDDDLFQEIDRDDARHLLNIPLDAFVVLSVGRLSLRTKTDWSPILELLSRMLVTKRLPKNFQLVIAGGGADENVRALEELVERAGVSSIVTIHPNFHANAKRYLYRASDVYLSIVDNFQETFGINIIEAMASGLPVIASDFDGYRDAVVDDQNGFLIPTYFSSRLPSFIKDNFGVVEFSTMRLCLSQMLATDLPKLEAALLELHGNGARRAQMGEASRHRAQRYKWCGIIKEYEAFWQELLCMAQSGSQVARKVRPVEFVRGFDMQSYLHFPSRIIADDTIFSLTNDGAAVLARSDSLTRYADVEVGLSDALQSAVVRELRAVPRSRRELASLATSATGAASDDIDFVLLWLLKHGIVRAA